MNYENYKRARDCAWRTLINCNINSLPIDLYAILERLNLKAHAYSESSIIGLINDDITNSDGFIAVIDKEKHIFFNDKLHNKNRTRFTIAHEIGHSELCHPLDIIFRNSEIDNPNNLLELEANIFARDLLAPACILKELDIYTPEDIMKLCKISEMSAIIRATRMKELYQRNKFYISPLEKVVKDQFSLFIQKHKNDYKKP